MDQDFIDIIYIYIYIYMWALFCRLTLIANRDIDGLASTNRHRLAVKYFLAIQTVRCHSFCFIFHRIALSFAFRKLYFCNERTAAVSVLCMRPASERRRYFVTSSLIGWVHTQMTPVAVADVSFPCKPGLPRSKRHYRLPLGIRVSEKIPCLNPCHSISTFKLCLWLATWLVSC